MNFDTFKILHSEIICCCQRLENDLKYIYSFMLSGNPEDNFDRVGKATLGTLLTKLKELDNSDGKPFLSSDDYNFLKQMTERRNYWCHQCYADFIYEKEFLYSERYYKICSRLQKDYDRFMTVSQNVEAVRLEAVKLYNR